MDIRKWKQPDLNQFLFPDDVDRTWKAKWKIGFRNKNIRNGYFDIFFADILNALMDINWPATLPNKNWYLDRVGRGSQIGSFMKSEADGKSAFYQLKTSSGWSGRLLWKEKISISIRRKSFDLLIFELNVRFCFSKIIRVLTFSEI